MSVAKRLNKELKDMMDESPVNYSATPVNEEDLMLWQAVIFGPNNTEYENGTFFLRVQFPLNYPFKPPIVHFVTPILHIDINSHGYFERPVVTSFDHFKTFVKHT